MSLSSVSRLLSSNEIRKVLKGHIFRL